ncbi:hypothetical protein IW262DRAFT_1294099 [Armillaria fumosa]|nr:hypothetical protein IW262DRAFT_1294099 [Armillaria fumosa]
MSAPPSPSKDMTRFQYYAKFDLAGHYRAYRRILNMLLPGWHQAPQETMEEVAQFLRRVYDILREILTPFEESGLIDSHVGAFIRGYLTRMHMQLPARLRILGWDGLIRCTAGELRPSHHLAQYALGDPLPGESRFRLEDPPLPLEAYLLQQEVHAISGSPFLPPKANTVFPSVVFPRFPTPDNDDDDDDEAPTLPIPDAPSASEHESAPLVPELSSPPLPIPATPVVFTAGPAPPTKKKVILPPVASLLSPCHTGAQSSTNSPSRVPPTSAAIFSLFSQANATPTHPNLANLMEGHPATPPTNFNELARQMAETVHMDSPMPILTTPGRKPASFNPLFPSAGPPRASPFIPDTVV